MRTPIIAACGLLLAATPAFAETVTLASGRTFATPTEVAGCTAPAATASAKAATTYAMTCTISVDGTPKAAVVNMTVFGPVTATNQDFFRSFLQNLGRADHVNDPGMRPKPRTIRTRGAAGVFLCYAMDDVARKGGGEVCALEGEPGVRLTVVVTTTDARSAVQIMNQVLGASTLQ